MEQIRTETSNSANRARPDVSTSNPGVSEPSFVEALVDAVRVFRDPREVVEHPWFTDEEKRTILLSWARDELVIEQVATNVMPELNPKSRIDAVVEALSEFDASAAGEYLAAVKSIRGTRSGRRKRARSH